MRLICLVIAVLTLFSKSYAINLATLRYCCGLGTNYAISGLQCDSFQKPITGIKPDQEDSCIQSIKNCCKNKNNELSCNNGIEVAKNQNSCGGNSTIEKNCCTACLLGQETKQSQGICDADIGLEPQFASAFRQCCTETVTTTTKPTTEAVKNSPEPTLSSYAPLPPLENVCDIGDVCAQICTPTETSYQCGCNKGFTLMSDGISCKPDKRSGKKGDQCVLNNPCEHKCIDTGVAVKCSCYEGFELQKDKKSCIDINECAVGSHSCTALEECVNEEGSFYCDQPIFESKPETDDLEASKCPIGYKFNYEKLVCDDIDECEFNIICPRPKVCINTVGSFKCDGEDNPQCPPGFRYKPSTESCTDIDECITGDNDCNRESQVCLNTKGNYTCVDKVSKNTCPPGFKKNLFTQNCDDIDECVENDDACDQNEECVNEPGGHNCIAKEERNNKTYPTSFQPPYVPISTPRPTIQTQRTTRFSTTDNSRRTTASTSSIFTTTTTRTTPATTTTTTQPPRQVSCPTGYRFNQPTNRCIDVNECEEQYNLCDSNQDCYNSPGSYICNCKTGFYKDYATGACTDVNECQQGTHECTVAQRCDNTIGSYLCARMTGCGTGYTLNYANGLCEDDDECILGTHTCASLGPNFKCRNTFGSYRCDVIRPSFRTTPRPRSTYSRPPSSIMPPLFTTVNYPIISGTLKKCLPGYIMNANGNCEDVDECKSNPCARGQKCLNFNGRYQCLPGLQCKIGYELDANFEDCIDINECARGTHKCKPTQICKNGQGFYTCECPPGHHINLHTQSCEDIDECKYRACSINADCVNSIGSFKCHCKKGFRGQGKYCEDIDECKENGRLCEHSCVNIWGSYRCACKPGFVLNYDNRTCTDIDECDKFRDKRLCIGSCENIPGSYRCKCPDGYRLGNDGRTCIDIDECQHSICPRHDDICLNIRGGYRCYAITCPANYFRDPQHKGRCKRPQTLCDPRDIQCILMPEQYTYHYITLVSNMPISDNVQFFQMNAPKWTRAEYAMSVVHVNAAYKIEHANERFFKMVKPEYNTMQLFLVRSIAGPQEVELKVEMHLYRGNVMTANVVSHIFIVVSEHPF